MLKKEIAEAEYEIRQLFDEKKRRRKFFIEIAVLVVLTVSLITLISLIFRSTGKREFNEEIIQVPAARLEYGIIVDSLQVVKGKVGRNLSLSDILSMHNVDRSTIHKLAAMSRGIFDVRKIREGNEYTLIKSAYPASELIYFIYQESPSNYVVYHVKDSLSVVRGEKPVEKVIRQTGGIIQTSLWNSIVDKGDDPNLANDLSEVYAWNIDFFGIQEGDYYRVIYEELIVEGKPIGLGRIIAACFNHMEHNYYAFYFVQKGVGGYYDEKAENCQRAFLKAPLRFKRISSRFTHSRYHPVLKIRRPHLGVDYAADYGTPVQTVGNGVVIDKGRDGKGGGNFVKIRHNGTYTTLYMHLSGFVKGLREGSHVTQGDVIGYVGSTGLSTGPHLDFRFYRNGQPVDPLRVESPPSEPVDPANMAEYIKIKGQWQDSLGRVQIIGTKDSISEEMESTAK